MGGKRKVCEECSQNCLLIHGFKRDASPLVARFFKFLIGDDFSEVLFLPPRFARTMSKLLNQDMYLEDACGSHHQVTLSIVDGSVAIQKGWREFSLDHNLQEGDFLVFNLVSESYFVVQIFEKSGSERVNFGKANMRHMKRARTSASEDKSQHTDATPVDKHISSSPDVSGSHATRFQRVNTSETSNFVKGNKQPVSVALKEEEPPMMINRDPEYNPGQDRIFLYDLSTLEMPKISSPAQETKQSLVGEKLSVDLALTSERYNGGELVDSDLVGGNNVDPLTPLDGDCTGIRENVKEYGEMNNGFLARALTFSDRNCENTKVCLHPALTSVRSEAAGRFANPDLYGREAVSSLTPSIGNGTEITEKVKESGKWENGSLAHAKTIKDEDGHDGITGGLVDPDIVSKAVVPPSNENGCGITNKVKESWQVKNGSLEHSNNSADGHCADTSGEAVVPLIPSKGDATGLNENLKESGSLENRPVAHAKSVEDVQFGDRRNNILMSCCNEEDPCMHKSKKFIKQFEFPELAVVERMPKHPLGKTEKTVKCEVMKVEEDVNYTAQTIIGKHMLLSSNNEEKPCMHSSKKFIERFEFPELAVLKQMPKHPFGKTGKTVKCEVLEEKDLNYTAQTVVGKERTTKPVVNQNTNSAEEISEESGEVDFEVTFDSDYFASAVVDDRPFLVLPVRLPSIPSTKLKADRSDIVLLRGLDKQRAWPVYYHVRHHFNVFASGWEQFRRSNGIQPGDECKFHVEDVHKHIYRVDIVRK